LRIVGASCRAKVAFAAAIGYFAKRVKIGVLIAAACFWVTPAAGATRFTLEYEAPAGCPSREAFLEAVRERAPDAVNAAIDAQFAFRVMIEAAGDLARGRVSLGDGSAERVIVPAPCADVTSSIALMIAIVLSGDAERKEAAAAVGPGAESEATPAQQQEAAQVSASPKPPQHPAMTRPEAAPLRVRGAPAESRMSVSVRGGAWGAVGLSDGVAPFPAAAASGGVELGLDVRGWLRPSARAGVAYVSGDASVAGLGGAEFALLSVVARLCPHTFAFTRRWSVSACGSLELGELTARGSTENGLVQRMPWQAIGVASRVEFALTRILSLEGELGVRGIVQHDRFVFEPDATEVYDVPRFAPHLSLGASARFP
jgi:hypothetical protein